MVGEWKCVVTVCLWMKVLVFGVKWAEEAGAFFPGL